MCQARDKATTTSKMQVPARPGEAGVDLDSAGADVNAAMAAVNKEQASWALGNSDASGEGAGAAWCARAGVHTVGAQGPAKAEFGPQGSVWKEH